LSAAEAADRESRHFHHAPTSASENGERRPAPAIRLSAMPRLDDDQLYRALVSRDARFDGVFFVGVTSTRVYCRPVCRAAKPRADRCRYYASAAAAERDGFRPCLRCRPELAPGGTPAAAAPSVDAVARLAHAAAGRIAAGALDRGPLETLAADLGVSSRHLRRAVERELGASPAELAQTRRLLTAKQLLAETDLPITSVAYASGFGSLRRFNALFRARYRLAPSAIRRRAPARAADGGSISLTLAYRAPLAWEPILAYLAGRATPGVELVGGDGRYRRTVRLHGHRGHVAVGRGPRDGALRVDVSAGLVPVLVPLLARLRRLFDLDADPAAVAAHLSADPALAPLVARRPGLRVPGAIDGFELALRAVLGQQVSVRGATTLAGRLAALVGEPLADAPAPLSHLPVSAERLAEAGVARVAAIGLTRKRAECVVALARAVASGELPELAGDAPPGDPSGFVERFTALPGIGPWTAQYVVMRGLGWPDAFPDGDLALRKAMGGPSPARMRAAAERWRPWRSYAAQYLWASLGDRDA
jgi:AraC family transcriptional regulator of adaptative response / DNA-3-methyladenine glycosylase II